MAQIKLEIDRTDRSIPISLGLYEFMSGELESFSVTGRDAAAVVNLAVEAFISLSLKNKTAVTRNCSR
jgi:hypothetical protein